MPHAGATANGSPSGQWPQQAVGLGGGLTAMAPLAQDVYRTQAAMFLQRIHAWLERTTPSIPQFAQFIPPMMVGVELYRVRRNQESLAQAYSVAQALQQVIALNPALPPL
ncbi:hypothetical protein BCD49_22120 [Pseudofrankia sp. EUN1h]|nr:hypothetical protein BCD49_22120 [Pseudofrankia sp. EUN1h]